MRCPKCQGKTVVTTSKDLGIRLRRRRKCLKCDFRYTTIESTLSLRPHVKFGSVKRGRAWNPAI